MIASLDTYSVRARWIPAVATVFALSLAIASWLPGLRNSFVGQGLLLAILAPILAHLARERGKALETGLWTGWGGPPTTQLLRHRNPHLPPDRVALYHGLLAKVFPDIAPLPQPTTPQGASDAAWETATKRLIARTRDRSRFRVLFAENCNYGFWRNLFALKKIGAWISVLAVAIACTRIAWQAWSGKGLDEFAVAAAAIAAVGIFFFAFVLDERHVRTNAFAYAERLLETTEMLASEPEATRARGG